jgi:hypothetical protein
MFRQMDTDQSGKIGMEEWVQFSMSHIAEKVRTLHPDTVDFSALEKSTPEEFVSFLELAMQNRHSEEFKGLFEHLFKTFVEQDVMMKGTINFEEFDLLVEEAARAPRSLRLAPQAHECYQSTMQRQQVRRELFDTMDKDKGGTITFDEYLNWAIGHIASKIQEFQAGNRYVPPATSAPLTHAAAPVTYAAAPAVTYASAPAVRAVSGAPITYAAAPVTYAASPAMAHSIYSTQPAYSAAPVAYAGHGAPVAHAQYGAPVHYTSPGNARR